MKAKSYGVFEKATGKLVEGGFFTKWAAEKAAAAWASETGKEYFVRVQH